MKNREQWTDSDGNPIEMVTIEVPLSIPAGLYVLENLRSVLDNWLAGEFSAGRIEKKESP